MSLSLLFYSQKGGEGGEVKDIGIYLAKRQQRGREEDHKIRKMAPNRKTNIEQENCATDEENSSENRVSKWRKGHESLDSIPSMISDSLPVSGGPSSLIGLTASHVSEQMTRMCLDPDFSPDEVEEKARLISQVSYLKKI